MRLKLIVLLLCTGLLLPACNVPVAPTVDQNLVNTAVAEQLTAQAPTITPLPPTPIPPTETPIPAPMLPVLINQQFSEESNTPATYTINAAYPHLDPATVSQTEPFDSDVETLVMSVVNAMRTDFLTAGIGLPDPTMGSTLEVNYNAPYISPNLISLKFYFNFYYAGAAHPNMMYQSYTYDVVNQQILALADLFQSGSNYLQVVSDYCVAELTTRLGADAWLAGAGPDLANFKTWNITPTGLAITFDPYQVAAYAAGPQEVLIPYDVLSSIYLPQYRP